MPQDPNSRQNGEESAGQHIAAEMLKNIVLLNENIAKSHAIQASLAESSAALTDYHETYMRAVEILLEQTDEGKTKFTVRQILEAISEAAAEVMPEEEEEEEPGSEDPLVRSR